MQSFYTRSQTLQKAQKEGFDIYFYKRRDAFNRGIDERNQAFSANAFLLMLCEGDKLLSQGSGKRCLFSMTTSKWVNI